ncbi:MAG: bifunctional transaldolase/phosoglucose isomerase [Anaerolineae bacterium]
MTRAHELVQLGQSLWLDYIRRSFLNNGGLQDVVDQGVRGVTSNPSIFEKAIGGSDDYDSALSELVTAGHTTGEIYEALAVADIQQAADILRPVYDETKGLDGYVSLEVSPTLAHDTDGTINEARRLHQAVNRPNVMIKVPATPEGIPAIQTLIADGININVTLIFAVAQYEEVALAYIRGLESLATKGGDLSKVASVASFFVSRVDGLVDKALEGIGNTDLMGKIAIANAKVAYALFQQLFSGERWESLAAQGAQVQRPLWASTSTKNPSYPATLYVDNLIGPHTVNTLPAETFTAFLESGTARATIHEGVEEARAQIEQLAALGIDLNSITDKLLADGVAAFAKSFEALMQSVDDKRQRLEANWTNVEAQLGEHQAAVDAALRTMRDEQVMHRIWAADHTVWKNDPTEITNRLGWLRIMDVMESNVERITHLTDVLRSEGYTQSLLLGMGGSSLAPEVFRKTFGVKDEYLDLAVLDSTDPGTVLHYERLLDLEKTLFIVSTKSGGTAETLSFFKYFYNRLAEKVGQEEASRHFIAITDPGSSLEALADRYHFRATFLNDPNIGGRYSALSYFGLVPAGLLGVDLRLLLRRASTMAMNCSAENCPSEGDNNGGRVGAMMGELAKAGRDKLTFIISPAFESFGDWVEQLIAESTGKEGKGILPVVGEPVGTPDVYSHDRVFVYLRLDETHDAAVNALAAAGHPVITVKLNDLYDLGGQFFLWEMATAVAGYSLGINPFDQPNVESAKVLARQMIKEYEATGKLPELTPTLQHSMITVYGDVEAATPGEALRAFLAQAPENAYIALQAYIQPTREADFALLELRTRLRDVTKHATTVGYGPRFLHSTGQLHKGDAGNGMFIQFTAQMPEDVAIPDEAGADASAMSFGTLEMSQALGDRQALLDEGRHVIRFDLGGDIMESLKVLSASLSK